MGFFSKLFGGDNKRSRPPTPPPPTQAPASPPTRADASRQTQQPQQESGFQSFVRTTPGGLRRRESGGRRSLTGRG